MDPTAVVNHFDGVPQTARRFKVCRQTVYFWLRRKKMPERRARQAHSITRGKLKFRPRDYPLFS